MADTLRLSATPSIGRVTATTSSLPSSAAACHADEIPWASLPSTIAAVASAAACQGRPASGGPFKVRVRVGSQSKLDRIAGFDGASLIHPIVGLAVGPKGEVYVLTSEGSRGRSELVVLDSSGKYLRTIMPYPAATPPERTASVGQLEIDGERLPIVFNAHGHNLLPLTSGMKKQRMVFSPKGHLLMASAVGTICNHGPP